MSKEEKITNDIKVPNRDLEALRLNFPHCFDKDGNFQIEKFKANLTEKEINFSTESYGLDWLGKSYARLLASDPATTLLKADETHNSKPENANSENLLIKGDNLEVLKHLANAYYEQVKMIYIDPPYNTGNDGFLYQDDRKFTVKELQNLIGIDAEKAKRILDFTKQKSNSHSAWLTFMYPRLYLAKQLLKDEGVIFVSIDDNEVAQLRLLMDEVFGEENFVESIIWKNKYGAGAKTTGFITTHEFILCYSKKSLLNIEGPLGESQLKAHNQKDENFTLRGPYRTQPVQTNSMDDRPNLVYAIEWNGEEIWPNKQWVWSKERMLEAIERNEVIIEKKKDGTFSIRSKQYLKDLSGNLRKGKPLSVMNGPFTQEGTDEIRKLFNKDIFPFPKPKNLISYLLDLTINEIDDKNSIYLDFFAGSGTSGDAIMQLNAEDGGNRKFILVQIPEPIDPKKNKVAYDFVKNELKAEPTIFEITKERLLRSAKKINSELDSKIEKLKTELPIEENKTEITKYIKLKSQNSFKVFETKPIWEDYDIEAEQFDSSQTLFDAGKLTEEDVKALLVTWKTFDNISLSQELESIDLGGYTAFYGSGKLYLMNKNFTTENLKAVLEKIDTDKTFNPTSIIAFGYHFESKSLRELSENVKQYANKKKIDIDFITRY